MDLDYDVVIIGAGPVGGYTARLLCERGLSVVMVEEHNEVGRPFQCAGLVTPSAMDAVEAYDTVVEDVDGALIHGPSGTLVPVGRQGELRTYVVCRKRFDQTVVQQGLEAGADLLLESQPTSAEVKPNGVEIEIINQRTKETRTLRSKLLIGCDGAHSWVRRRFKMGHPKGDDGWIPNRSRWLSRQRTMVRNVQWFRNCPWLFCLGHSIGQRYTSNWPLVKSGFTGWTNCS